VPAKLQTNGFIAVGSQVCVIDTGEGLIVKMMPTPPPVEPDDTAPVEQYKIKILWTIGTKLYMGSDRSKPKLIHEFPAGTVIRGVCHNQGDGDRFAIGVVATLGDKHEQWNWTGSPKESATSKLLDFKSSRIQPIGHGWFVDPWLPPDMRDGRLLGRSRAGKLFVFTNEMPCLVGEYPQLKSAYVLRKKGDDFDVITEVGTVKASIGKSALTEAKKAKWKDWVWLLFDDLATDRDGSVFKNKNMTGSSIVSGSRITRDLKLKAWKTLKAVFDQMGALWTRTENTWGEQVSFQVGKGQFDAAAITDVKIELKRTVGQRPIGAGDDIPPPGNDPNNPYAGMYFSFISGETEDYDPRALAPFSLTVRSNVWIARNVYGDLTTDGQHYLPGPTTAPLYSTREPSWQTEGVFLSRMSYSAWNGLIDSYRAAYNALPRRPIPRSLLPPWLAENSFDSYYRYNTNFHVPGDLMWPVYRYMDRTGAERYSGGVWSNNYFGFRAIGWKGESFLNPDSDPNINPPDREPQYEPWEVELYKWRDPIVCSKDGKYLLLKQWIESASKGRPPSPPMSYKASQIVLMTGTKETTIKGDLPLLTAEDQLIGAKLYRVDRSPLESLAINAPQPIRSTIRRLPVEIYALGTKATRSIKTEKIYPVPQEAIVLSASYHP
jgi:hypothetical protein